MDFYEILQVDRNAGAEVIQAAYRALARRHHPDVGGDPARMVSINEAWAVLGNATRRRGYDITLRRTTALATAARFGGASVALAEEPRYQPQRSAAAAPSGDRVLDFGRYAGLSLTHVSRHDPDYLLWLERTMVGRTLRSDIEHVMQTQHGPAAAVATAPAAAPRRGRWFR